MNEDALKRAAWRIIELTTFVSTHSAPQVWGHDTCLGTQEELTAEAVDILKEELGWNTGVTEIVGVVEPPPLGWQIDCYEGAGA